MIICPYCNSTKWKNVYRCPLDPANDEFICYTCNKSFRRYTGTKYETKKEARSMKYHVFYYGEKIASFKRKGDAWYFCKMQVTMMQNNNRSYDFELYEGKKLIKKWEV